MDTLYLEKWNGTFETSRGKEKFPVLSLWKLTDTKLVRLAEWIEFPWGGAWEDVSYSEKGAVLKNGKVCKMGWKHSYPLQPVKEAKQLSQEQLNGLAFIAQYPERGWTNWKKFTSSS